MAPYSIWIITNGRRGDIVQCRAIAEKLIQETGGNISEKELHPRTLWSFTAPFCPLDPLEKKKLHPPYPDLIVASGRRSVPAVRYIKKKTKGHCQTIFMKYPGVNTDKLGLSWIPEHDKRKGALCINTLTSPHLVGKMSKTIKRARKNTRFDHLSGPRLGIILGGNSHHVTYDDKEINNLIKPLENNHAFSSYLVTGSRRTPKKLLIEIRKKLSNLPHFIWDGEGDNPYFDILASCDAFYVTGDSHNMVSEVLAMGKKTYIYKPRGNASKLNYTLEKLQEKDLISFDLNTMQAGNQPAIDATDKIVAFIKEKLDL